MNVFEFSQTAEANWKLNLKELSGYEPKYTFYSDFGIAEYCQVYMNDKDAIRKTFNSVIKNWKGSVDAMVEIVLIMNHKIWSYFSDTDEPGVDAKYLGVPRGIGNDIAKLYDELWDKAKEIFFNEYEDDKEAMSRYFEVCD